MTQKMKTITSTITSMSRSIGGKRLYAPWGVLGGWTPQFRLSGVLQAFARRHRRDLGLTSAVNRDPEHEPGTLGMVNEIVTDGDWVQVTPWGEFPNGDLIQVVDREAGEAMVREFNSILAKMATRFRGVPFFVGHPDAEDPEDREIDPRYGKASIAWGKELQVRADGLWAKQKRSAAANEIIDNGYFMYLSPYWGMRPIPGRKNAYRPAVLYSVGFTNNPNIPGLPVGKNTKQGDTTMPKWLIEMLVAAGLFKAANEATEEATKPVITDLLRARTTLTEVQGNLTTAQNEKKQLEIDLAAANEAKKSAEKLAATNDENFKNERKARIDDVLTTAVNEGRIKAADRPAWAGKLTGDFDGELKNLTALKKSVNTDAKSKSLGNRKGEQATSSASVAAINTAAAKYAKENGLDVGKDRVLIFNALRTQQPNLFEESEETAAD